MATRFLESQVEGLKILEKWTSRFGRLRCKRKLIFLDLFFSLAPATVLRIWNFFVCFNFSYMVRHFSVYCYLFLFTGTIIFPFLLSLARVFMQDSFRSSIFSANLLFFFLRTSDEQNHIFSTFCRLILNVGESGKRNDFRRSFIYAPKQGSITGTFLLKNLLLLFT